MSHRRKPLPAARVPRATVRVANGFRPAAYDPDQDDDLDTQGEPDEDDATVYVYDAIGGFFGVEASAFVKAVAGLKAKTIHLRLNSPGGDVFDARAMATALAAHPAKVVAHVDGLAASAASFLMLAADEIEMSDGAFVMIHNPMTVAAGDARDMRQTADLLDKVRDAIAADYVKRTGKPTGEIVGMMDAETWLTASEAVAQGFADRVVDGVKPKNRFDLTVYDHAPAALTEAPAEDAQAAALEAMRQRQTRLAALYARAPA